MDNISLLGCGTWGSALAQVLAENGHKVTAWHYKDEAVAYMSNSRKHPNLNGFQFHESIAFDIGSYRSAPPGLRIWGGPTVDNEDIKRLLPCLDWAFNKTIKKLKIV